MSLDSALQMSIRLKLDLVEIQPNAEPPVVRIMDQGKFAFQQNKQRALAKKKQQQPKVKEIKFRPNTDKADYDVKVNHIKRFLEEGDKVKITVWFKGRELSHQKLGVALLDKVKVDLDDCAKVDFFPKLDGSQMIMIVSPKKK